LDLNTKVCFKGSESFKLNLKIDKIEVLICDNSLKINFNFSLPVESSTIEIVIDSKKFYNLNVKNAKIYFSKKLYVELKPSEITQIYENYYNSIYLKINLNKKIIGELTEIEISSSTKLNLNYLFLIILILTFYNL
jgi:hypothetical protein